MGDYLIQWENGRFWILTGEQLKDEMEEWDNVPPRVYRLIPDRHPERMWGVKVNGSWLLVDIHNNQITL